MAGGGNYVLNKGYQVLKTYNGTGLAVTRYRAVKLTVVSSAIRIDLNVSPTVFSIGVVQEDIDAVKVAYGNAVANVALLGITKMFVNVTPGAIAIGSPIMVGSAGGAVLATAGGTNYVLGTCVGMSVPGGTVAAGDLIDVLLSPTQLKLQ
jgi:hypothetical protein